MGFKMLVWPLVEYTSSEVWARYNREEKRGCWVYVEQIVRDWLGRSCNVVSLRFVNLFPSIRSIYP